MTAAGGRMVVKSRESSEELQSKGKKHSKLTYLVEKKSTHSTNTSIYRPNLKATLVTLTLRIYFFPHQFRRRYYTIQTDSDRSSILGEVRNLYLEDEAGECLTNSWLPSI